MPSTETGVGGTLGWKMQIVAQTGHWSVSGEKLYSASIVSSLSLHFITITTIVIVYFISIISLPLYQTKDFFFFWFSTPSHQGAGGVGEGLCGP